MGAAFATKAGKDIKSTWVQHGPPFFIATWVVKTPLAAPQVGGCDAALNISNPAPPRALSTGGAGVRYAIKKRSNAPRPRPPEAFQEVTEPTGGGNTSGFSACKAKPAKGCVCTHI